MIIIDVKDPCGFDLSADAECLQQLERQALPSYLLDQRWYGAKSDVPPIIRVDRSIHFGPSSWILILAVTVQQEQRHYFVPVSAGWDAVSPTDRVIAELRSESSSGWLIDAFGNDRFVCGLLRGICTGSIEETNGLIFRRSTSFNPAPGFPEQVQITRPGAEQSNTSIVAGSVILKAYRRLEDGIHPEVEVGAFLTDTAGFGNVPEMLGTIEHVRSGANEPTVLCVLQSLIHDSRDGWNYVAGELASPSMEASGDCSTRLCALAGQIGVRTAELHRAFALGSGPAFAPEPISERWLKAWAATLTDAVRTACSRLQDLRPAVVQDATKIESLISRGGELSDRIEELMPNQTAALRTRLHGDFHLGQTLVSANDIFIVDFEGEPMRPLVERRGKYLPIRDVAGMLRSFDYACATETRRRGLDAKEAPRLLNIASEMKSGFLENYRNSITGCLSFPEDLSQADDFLHLCLIEKSLYEISYELANRPDWVHIPIDGLISILDGEPVLKFRGEHPATNFL